MTLPAINIAYLTVAGRARHLWQANSLSPVLNLLVLPIPPPLVGGPFYAAHHRHRTHHDPAKTYPTRLQLPDDSNLAPPSLIAIPPYPPYI